MTAPYGKNNDTGRIELSSEVMKRTGAATETKVEKNFGQEDKGNAKEEKHA